MKKIFYVFLLISLWLIQPSCSVFKGKGLGKSTKQDTVTTASGLKYIVQKKMSDKLSLAKAGETVTVHYTGFFKDSTIFDSSLERGRPIKFVLGTGRVIKGWDEGLQLMRTGEKFRFIIPYQLAYGERSMGKIPPRTDLIFDVELIYHEPEKEIEAFKTEGLDTLTTPTGLKLIKVKSTKLDKPKQGDKLSVHYTGYLPDGKVFDSSVKRDKPIEFKVGIGQVIKGWDEALLMMREGEKARLMIPSNLAYGSRGAGHLIPPNTPLIFDIHLLEIK